LGKREMKPSSSMSVKVCGAKGCAGSLPSSPSVQVLIRSF
jgi:hypothetical protein